MNSAQKLNELLDSVQKLLPKAEPENTPDIEKLFNSIIKILQSPSSLVIEQKDKNILTKEQEKIEHPLLAAPILPSIQLNLTQNQMPSSIILKS